MLVLSLSLMSVFGRSYGLRNHFDLLSCNLKKCDSWPHLWFSKISKSRKNTKDARVLGWGWPIFQISKNQGSPPLKLSTVEKNDSRYRLQGHEREKEREISSFTLTFSLRAVRSYSMDRDFPFPNYGHQRSEQYSFLQDLGNTPPIFPVVSAEQRKPESHCYTVRPHGKCRDCTQFHRSNFPCVIDAGIFACWNATVWCQFYFHFRSDAICFSADFSSQNRNCR